MICKQAYFYGWIQKCKNSTHATPKGHPSNTCEMCTHATEARGTAVVV